MILKKSVSVVAVYTVCMLMLFFLQARYYLFFPHELNISSSIGVWNAVCVCCSQLTKLHQTWYKC